MSRIAPYLLRRGNVFTFRIAVPHDLRPLIGKREITKTLYTTDKRAAIPRGLRMAAKVKELFEELRQMPPKDKRVNSDAIEFNYSIILELDDFQKPKKLSVNAEAHEEQAVNSAIRTALSNHQEPATSFIPTQQAERENQAPLLSKVVSSFLNDYPKEKKLAMFRKHQTCLPLFLEIVGDKPVSDLKQTDVNEFFKTLLRLPPRWKDQRKKKNLSVKELANLHHQVTIGPKTLDDGYKACIRAFLKKAKTNYQDQGFPTTLTTEGIEYEGSREEGERKQRAFKLEELKLLFEGKEMKKVASDPAKAAMFWLPHIGLFTGARVNELCQINPQTDILQEPETGIWYFWITVHTDGDERIDKSIKNQDSKRKVPIHPRLLELGALNYFEKVKTSGSKLLFPMWKPSRGRASPKAEKWFRQFIGQLGLRDETPENCILGMHAFRHTIENAAYNRNLNVDAIVGHAGEVSSVKKGYRGELSLTNKLRLIEQITFEIQFVRPKVM
jgi:hypothetical protein